MLRNKEVRRFAVVFCCITLAAAIPGFSISRAAGLLLLALAAALGAAFFVFTRARYQSIAQLSEQIDLVLHHADRLYLAQAEEGELSILQSEIAKMTLRIREQNEALKQEKSQLSDSLADIAHQLRTPLTSVNLVVSLWEASPDESRRKAQMREIKQSLAQMDWLLASLLKLSRLDAGIVVFQCEPIQAAALLEQALRPLLIPMELHNITLQKDIPADILLHGDANWLAEAIENILKNCMESAGDGGTIALACTDNPIFTEITIHDSGPGFAKEDLAFLFERFYRGKSTSTAGYGIGLALCQSIIHRQNGILTAKNHPQGGALFSIRFPK